MVYLKPLYSSLDRLAQRQGSPFSTEAQHVNVKILFSICHIFLSKKIGTEKYWVYIVHGHPCRPEKQWWSFQNTAY